MVLVLMCNAIYNIYVTEYKFLLHFVLLTESLLDVLAVHFSVCLFALL